jgi:site-specific recombinase XerD
MGITQSSRSSCIDWLAAGPFAPHIDAYKQYLTERGYAANTFSNCMRSIAHFAQWTRSRRLQVRRIDESVVAEFLDGHLPECQCTGSICRDRRSLSAALGHLLVVVLRARGIVAPPAMRSTPVDGELLRYDTYMDHVRGLAPKTRSIALRIVGRLLVSRFGDGAIDIAAIKPDHVRRFFAQQAKLYSKPATAGTVVSALHGYFRYRTSLGNKVHGLIGVLSFPANWQLSSLPKTLTAEEVEQLLIFP